MIYNKQTITNSITETVRQTCKYVYQVPQKTTHFTILFLFFLSIGMQPSYAQQQKIDSLNSILKIEKADSNKVITLYKLSVAYLDTEPYKAIEYANQGLAISNRLAFNRGISFCFHALGHAYYNLGKFDTALTYFEKRLNMVKTSNDRKGIATTYDNLSTIYIHFGENDKALNLRKKANDIYASLNEKSYLAGGYDWIGSIYKEQGEYSVALEYYLKALKIYEEINEEEYIGYPLINISSIYRHLKQYEKAKKYALDAKLKFSKANNPEGIGASFYRLALIYSEEKDYANTNIQLLEAKKIFEETQNIYFNTLVNLQLGTNAQYQGNNDVALGYFEGALATALQMGDKNLISVLFQTTGSAYQNKGDYLKALDYMYKSDKLLKEINDKNSLLNISPNFIEIFSHLNKPDSVSKYFNRYQELSDSLFNEQNSKSIAEMQTKYETEKKEKEIILLNLDNEKKKNNILLLSNLNEITILKLENSTIENEQSTQSLKLANAKREKQQARIEILKLKETSQALAIQEEQAKERLITLAFIIGFIVLIILALLVYLSFVNRKKKEQAILNQQAAELSRQVSENDMKALRAQMNPHFIFNCVHTIERLLNDSKIQESKTCLVKFSNLTRSVLENSKKKEIPLSEEIETLILYMELENLRFRNPFTYNIVIAPGIDIKTTLIPPLILQPFVENSIKHGFRETEKPGHLTVDVRIDNELLMCIVEDNGIGRKESMSIKPLSGFKKESMGIMLTEERLHLISKTKNNKAYFLIDDLTDTLNNPTGTRVKMFLPYELSI